MLVNCLIELRFFVDIAYPHLSVYYLFGVESSE